MALSEEDSRKADQEFHEIIAKRIEMDEKVWRELDEKGIMTGLDGDYEYYKDNIDWFNREIEKLREKYGIKVKK